MNKIFTNDGNYFNNTNTLNDTQIQVIKSSQVEKGKQIRLNEETLFQFDCIIDDNQLILKLSELDALAPFIYIKEITLDEIRKCHKAFKSCKDLNEVKEHIDKLFKNKRISLDQDKSDKTNVKIKFKIFYISYEDDFEIKVERKMTELKEQMLLKLYEIQKNQIKGLKEIENYLKKNGGYGQEIIQKINEIKEKLYN